MKLTDLEALPLASLVVCDNLKVILAILFCASI